VLFAVGLPINPQPCATREADGVVDKEEIKRAAPSSRDEPTAPLPCDPNGQRCLTGVELPAWQRIDLPRQAVLRDSRSSGWNVDFICSAYRIYGSALIPINCDRSNQNR
jgi:hypothetical protein